MSDPCYQGLSITTFSSTLPIPMLQTADSITIDTLKKQIRRLNSKAGQMKMDLHDIAEGLPADLEKLPEAATRTHDIYCQLRDLRKQLTILEAVR